MTEAPPCAAPDPAPRKPRLTLPPLACDCHAHVCGPKTQYDYFPERVYTPPDALLPAYAHMLATLGVERAVLVQPSVYGTDNSAMLDALKIGGARFRAVAVVAESVTDGELQSMHAAGVRGVRVNIVDVKQGKGELPLASLKTLAERVRPFGWHMEFLMHVDDFPKLDESLADFRVEVVFGHLGYMRPGQTPDAPGFQALLRLMRAGRAWAKLTGPYRISTQGLPHADTDRLAQALLAAAPAQVVWGTDWPHVMVKGAMPNDGELCDLLANWIPDAGLRNQVLVDNAARLYGFA